MPKKFFLVLVFFLTFFWLAKPVVAEDKVNVYFFWGKACPHCAKEKIFLEKMAEKYEGIEIRSYEISTNRENLALLKKIGQELKIDVSGVPFTAVGKYHFAGYLNDETTGKEIETAVQCALETHCPDLVGDVINNSKKTSKIDERKAIPKKINLPLVGEIKTENFSLPLFTFIIALVDGFNPCAMWVLLFLISLLLGMKDRRRMWLLGTVFIVASGLAYFLFLAAWLNLFLFLGFVFWVRILVGLIALGAGGFNLKEFLVNKEGGCETVGEEKRQKMFAKIRKIVGKKELLLALAGIVVLAFGVNLIELVCSAGLPAIYTQVLSLTKLPPWQYYLYLLFYILIFMLDDLFVFFVAMTTLQAVGVESKYARWSRLIGGFLMLAIGVLLLFKPELLMFG